jgi:hypothetical protein
MEADAHATMKATTVLNLRIRTRTAAISFIRSTSSQEPCVLKHAI